MNNLLRSHAQQIMLSSIHAVLPDNAVRNALQGFAPPKGKTVLVAAGKAAWQMASAAIMEIGRVDSGIVITKYGHCQHPLPGIICREAGHPIPDKNGFSATQEALAMVSNLSKDDCVLFLLSGGASALFEAPLISKEELCAVTQSMLACGAPITEINTIRKRLSLVKGGRFALTCKPAQVFAVVLSDVLGDRTDMIASGPVSPDSSTCAEAIAIAEKYSLPISAEVRALLRNETPKELDNVTMKVCGNVRLLCKAAERACQQLGYETIILTDSLSCEAKDAGMWLSKIAKERFLQCKAPLALIAGGETVVRLTGNGKGGRNQEIALAAARTISGLPCAVFSVGSDGTDGPTNAAGGYIDGDTLTTLSQKGIRIESVLQNNDSYHALAQSDGLLITGPTGTNVNDVSIALIYPCG